MGRTGLGSSREEPTVRESGQRYAGEKGTQPLA
jgi:hypothetical protein